MEHRWSVRKPHQCSVIVDCPRGGLAAAQLHNIGVGGMFVDIGKLDLPLNALVTVAFALGHDGSREEFCLPAMVVHRTDNGAGIMFLESEPDTLQILRRALNAATSLTPERTGVRDRRIAAESDIQVSRNATAFAGQRSA
jgi:PilZ domain